LNFNQGQKIQIVLDPEDIIKFQLDGIAKLHFRKPSPELYDPNWKILFENEFEQWSTWARDHCAERTHHWNEKVEDHPDDVDYYETLEEADQVLAWQKERLQWYSATREYAGQIEMVELVVEVLHNREETQSEVLEDNTDDDEAKGEKDTND